MKVFWGFFDRLLNAMAGLAGVILVFIVAAVCYTIGMRFFFKQTTIWIIQTTEYALLWIVFLATAWLLREGGHITTDIIYVHLSTKAKHYLNFIMSLVGALTCAIMLYYGAAYTYDCIINNVTDVRAITVPKAAVFVIIPIGSLLLTLQFLRIAWDRLHEIKAGR
ncbi:MAG TPA: TRAP transporter small permease [Syntrophorhabdaceae bacterium]|jgi:TRAP-type C4-dicarboxylate transport system permease small subunit